MSFTWPIDVAGLFAERTPQMLGVGIPSEDVDRLRDSITTMWGIQPGSWLREWSDLGESYSAGARHDLAAVSFGFAKFPGLYDEGKPAAYVRQREEYLLAAADFPVDFERRVLELNGGLRLPVHIFRAPGVTAASPVLLASGGVDGWKMDVDAAFLNLAQNTWAQVVMFDIPGTGENLFPFGLQSLALMDDLVAAARSMGDGRVFHIGYSVGGFYSAYTGLTGIVDGAVDLGGPVEQSFADPARQWRYGMDGIIGNLARFDHYPTQQELFNALRPLSLRPLLDQDNQSHMLIVNGADDVHIPQHDTVVFRGRRDTEVDLIPGTGHCAVSAWGEVLPRVAGWINARLK